MADGGEGRDELSAFPEALLLPVLATAVKVVIHANNRSKSAITFE
jgi:hypothetical protein